MARIGKKPISICDTKIKIDNNVLSVSDNKEQKKLSMTIPEIVDVQLKDQFIEVDTKEDSKESRALQGTIRQLINNMIIGVTEGYKKHLILEGVGYRAQVSGQKLTLTLGYSHPIEYTLDNQVSATVDGNTKIILESVNKQLIGQTAAEIKKFRPPEPYKGKGIKFEGEKILRKAGKTGKK